VEEAAGTEGEDLLDRVRLFAEEADGLQGFHILVDTHSAFGGLAEATVKSLHDDFGSSAAALVFPVSPAAYSGPEATPAAASFRFLNQILGVRGLAASAALTTPLSLAEDLFTLPDAHRSYSYLKYDPTQPYHTAAALAALVDTVSLPWRSRKAPVRIFDLTSGLNSLGRTLASLSASLPFAMDAEEFLVDKLNNDGGGLGLEAYSPSTKDCTDGLKAQVAVLRGVRRFRPPGFGREERYASHPYVRVNTMHEALTGKLMMDDLGALSAAWTSIHSCPTVRPFPDIFDGNVTANGDVVAGSARTSQKVLSVPVLTSWQSSHGGAGTMVASLRDRGKRVNLGRMHRFVEAGLESDEFKEVLEDLATLADNYD